MADRVLSFITVSIDNFIKSALNTVATAAFQWKSGFQHSNSD